MKLYAVALLSLAVAGCTHVLEKPEELDKAGPRPTLSQAKDAIRAYVANANLYSPQDARAQNVEVGRPERWHIGSPVSGGYKYGWSVYFELNATNRYGGYTGYRPRSILRAEDGSVYWNATP